MVYFTGCEFYLEFKKVVGEGVRTETGRRLLQNSVHKTELVALGGGKPERWTYPPHTEGAEGVFMAFPMVFFGPSVVNAGVLALGEAPLQKSCWRR